MIDREIVPGDRSGGATTSHTVVIPALGALLDVVDHQAEAGTYERAVLEKNVLGKTTVGSRKRTLRYLRELYLLRPDSVLFRALRDLWTDERTGQPLVGGTVCASSRSSLPRERPGDSPGKPWRRSGECRSLRSSGEGVSDCLQRVDAGEDWSKYLFVLGADRSSRSCCSDREGSASTHLHAVHNGIRVDAWPP